MSSSRRSHSPLNTGVAKLTSRATAPAFPPLPALVGRSRLTVCLGAATGCLFLLLLACWWYAGGWWIIGGLAITAASLALPWGWWAGPVGSQYTAANPAQKKPHPANASGKATGTSQSP